MSDTPAPVLTWLQQVAAETCMCGHRRGLHVAVLGAGSCSLCTCHTFTRADGQLFTDCGETGG